MSDDQPKGPEASPIIVSFVRSPECKTCGQRMAGLDAETWGCGNSACAAYRVRTIIPGVTPLVNQQRETAGQPTVVQDQTGDRTDRPTPEPPNCLGCGVQLYWLGRCHLVCQNEACARENIPEHAAECRMEHKRVEVKSGPMNPEAVKRIQRFIDENIKGARFHRLVLVDEPEPSEVKDG